VATTESFWDRRARGFALAARARGGSWFADFLGPWLDPSKTLIDVGAGTGALAVQLARRLRRVTAVEPSEGMREQMPAAGNVTVLGSSWEAAPVEPADLVVCVNVLHAIAEPAPFVEKLEAAATERVFVVMRDSPHTHPAERLGTRPRQRLLRDAFLLLRRMGIAPDLTMRRHRGLHHFESLDAAVEECRLCLGRLDDEDAARAWLAARTAPAEAGGLLYDGGEVVSGVLHWSPRG
jgi:cyclopropane fatty-acyl-phospholipid synthase-like methyltransferase